MDLTLEKKLQGFQLIAQEKLQAIICSIPGKKDLIIQPTLIKPLEHICSASWLKLKGIQRIFKLDSEHVIQRSAEDQVQIFMVRSHVPQFQLVLQQIHANERQLPTDTDASVKNFHIICLPNCFAYFHNQLEEEGLYGIVQLHHYNWDFIYLDQGVLSMEVENIFSSVFLRADTSLLPGLAHSLRVLQLVCGCPELVLSFGDHATHLAKMLHALSAGGKAPSVKPDFGAMLIIDRNKDYASALLTPTIYAGLLLEVFAHRTGEIDITSDVNKITSQQLSIFTPKSKVEPNPATSKRSTLNVIRLNSLSDEIYAENRYRHFTQASSAVRAQAKSLGVEVQKLNDMNVDEMHTYVARKLPKIAELKTKLLRHLNASEKVIALLGGNFQRIQTLEKEILNNASRKRTLAETEKLLATAGQRYNTLRLLCLQHLCVGLDPEKLAKFVRNYCNYFGFQHLAVFEMLALSGLLPPLPERDTQNKSAKLLLSQLPLPTKFQQTEFQATANRLKLQVSTTTESDDGGGDDAAFNTATSAESVTDNGAACPSYVFNHLYIPLVAQLCQLLLKSVSAEDCAAKLGMIDKLQLHLPAETKYPTSIKCFAQSVKSGEVRDVLPLRKRNIFLFIVGGVTYAEIAACNLVARQTGAQIVVASDTIISGADLIASAF